MNVNEECRYCMNYLCKKKIIYNLYIFAGYVCSSYCRNLSYKILYYDAHNRRYNTYYRKCSYCKYIFTDHNCYCLLHHCTIPIKNKYMNINIL